VGNFLTGWVTISFLRRTLLHGVASLGSELWDSSNINRTCYNKSLLLTVFFFQEVITVFLHILLVPSVHHHHPLCSFIMPLSKKCAHKFNFIIGPKSFSPLGLFEWTTHVKVSWCQLKTAGRIWQYFPMHFLQCFYCHSGSVWMCIVMEERNSFEWLTLSFWTKHWVYSVLKKLCIISCVDGSLFC
jgi:hypothetical protein